jgi:hypothetical protein
LQAGVDVQGCAVFEGAQSAAKMDSNLSVDASRCAATTGQFEIKFVRLKEFGPDLVFTENFRWTPGSVDASLNFWWDEAVQDYWIGHVEPCGCAD